MILPDIEQRPISWLKRNVGELNLCDQFADTTLSALGSDIVEMVEMDRASRTDWMESYDKGEKIAMQEREEKSFPWPNAANIKDPLIAVAMMQFAARAGAEVVRGRDVVKNHITGEDPLALKEERSKRVSMAMSYQCLTQMKEWMPGTDQLLSSLSGPGMYYKKTYYDPSLGRPISLACSPRKIIVHNDAVDLESAERVTHEFDWSRNKVIERIRGKQWADIEDKLEKDDDGKLDKFFECHCWQDMDGDGYKEPYTVTVHVDSGAVARIVARYLAEGITEGEKEEGDDNKKVKCVAKIEAEHHITEFPFLPSPDGKFHKMGFYKLLGAINEEINTVQNQLIDAGTLQNAPPVFVGKGAKLPSGNFRTAPGRFTPVESTGQALKDNIFIPTLAGPSPVLFNLLGRLDEKGMKLASVSETMMGDEPQANVPATTTLAILDQGLKVFSSILSRLYRAFESEFHKIYRINWLYMDDDEYIKIIDITAEELQKLGITEHIVNGPNGPIVQAKKGVRKLVLLDFNPEDCDIQPVMDPSAASEAIRLARANAIYQSDPQNPAVKRYYFQVLGVPEKQIDEFVPKQAPPNPAMIKLQADITQMQHKSQLGWEQLELKKREVSLKEYDTATHAVLQEAQSVLAKANSELALAQSDAIQVNMHVEAFQAQVDHLQQQWQNQFNAVQQSIDAAQGGQDGSSGTDDGSGGTAGASQGSSDEEGAGVSGSQESGGGAGLAGGQLSSGQPGGSGTLDPNDGSAMPSLHPHADVSQLATQERTTPMM